MSERLRLFVALDLPAAARDALAGWAAGVAPDGVRLVPKHDLHLTLVFLGARSSDDAGAVAALLPGLAGSCPILSTAGALWLPPRRPGVLSVAVALTGELAARRAGLVAALGEAIALEPERRAFRPHVTVGRVVGGARVRASELDPPPMLAFGAEALTLYRSRTGPRGARYEPLARVALRGG